VVDAFFSTLVNRTVPVANCAEAELVKLLENTFRHVNIALINELAKFARGLDVDIWRAIDAAATKPFGFMRFTPGPGVGGHCLPIDPSYLAWRVREHLGQNFRFVELANDINDHMPEYVHQRIIELLARDGRSGRRCFDSPARSRLQGEHQRLAGEPLGKGGEHLERCRC
jgi:UDP-N-acetyl-D-glucosamine dehydrogenase